MIKLSKYLLSKAFRSMYLDENDNITYKYVGTNTCMY